ncbi:flagellar M-ring protein FliF [Oxalobacter sp. OttesenSCG-928-P03]|nr:flagellar M-ring protein FliF [Oxalobacter sp. OttesenSCG-928-P03]
MAVAEEPGVLGDIPAAADTAADTTAAGRLQGRVAQARARLEEPRIRNIALSLGIALVIAIMAGIWMWSQKAEYAVLYSGFSEKDGGSIVSTLEQMEIPYKITNGGGSILVPADLVHGLRLKLASEGLPKASGVGFEVMENQKIGSSQFLEQVNFQRALEGELGRTIQSMDAIQHARVHLAMHKASVFVRDQQKPTASVLLTLYHGRSLDRSQVNAMVHLVASSVPGLTAANVTVVDQNGELLSWQDRERSETEKLDAKQMQYVQELQKNIVKRVESILAPVVGEKNVRAEATVEVDFSKSEQAEEIYKPNQAPNAPSIRSQHSTEQQKMAADPSGGIPGAVTNQPPVPPTAPLIQENPGQQQTAPPGQRVFTPVGQGSTNSALEGKKESVINYEVDKTLRYTQKAAMGEIKRVTVAVAVNYKLGKDEDGKEGLVPLTEAEKEEVAALVREAMGYNAQRGDSMSVLNTRFAPLDEGPPIWKRPETYTIAKDVGKYVIIAAIFLWLYMAFLKPMIYKLSGREAADRKKKEAEEAAKAEEEAKAAALAAKHAAAAAGDVDAIVALSGAAVTEEEEAYQQLLEMAKNLARENPKAVANIILEWLGND